MGDILSCRQADDIYPRMLKDIKKSPEELFYKGEIGIINEMPCLAIIGSREASSHGLDMAFNIGKMAAEVGFVVVNGLAIGCDTQALRGALSVGGKCVAVMPGGLDGVYPRSNEWLTEDILDKGGCMISEYSVGISPQKHFFIERDRLQSGVSAGVIVIETGESGGTMHTVKFAERQRRRLACYYSKLFDIAEGNRLIVESGMGIPLEDEKSVMDFLAEIREIKYERYEQMTLF